MHKWYNVGIERPRKAQWRPQALASTHRREAVALPPSASSAHGTTSYTLHFEPVPLAALWRSLNELWAPSLAAWLLPAWSKKRRAAARARRPSTVLCSSGGGGALQAGPGQAATGAYPARQATNRRVSWP